MLELERRDDPQNSKPAALGLLKTIRFPSGTPTPECHTRSACFYSLFFPTRFSTVPVDPLIFCISLRSIVLWLPVDNRAPVTANFMSCMLCFRFRVRCGLSVLFRRSGIFDTVFNIVDSTSHCPALRVCENSSRCLYRPPQTDSITALNNIHNGASPIASLHLPNGTSTGRQDFPLTCSQTRDSSIPMKIAD